MNMNMEKEKSVLFPGLLDRAQASADFLLKNETARVSEIKNYSGFSVIRKGEQEDGETVIHEFTVQDKKFLIVAR